MCTYVCMYVLRYVCCTWVSDSELIEWERLGIIAAASNSLSPPSHFCQSRNCWQVLCLQIADTIRLQRLLHVKKCDVPFHQLLSSSLPCLMIFGNLNLQQLPQFLISYTHLYPVFWSTNTTVKLYLCIYPFHLVDLKMSLCLYWLALTLSWSSCSGPCLTVSFFFFFNLNFEWTLRVKSFKFLLLWRYTLVFFNLNFDWPLHLALSLDCPSYIFDLYPLHLIPTLVSNCHELTPP